ncbi:N-acetylmuramoyl-L-alanine amidase family protein [Anaeroselena agilis]|uniref:N-acetylmuramoyl-L-alanine amidase n=1 Tax=Anaeroselena agilis TaxID=3063788 RepID=A0ABU3NWJ3_9FIRM|nr:N-acetylmuramoyl-L-alanine amidase [Selenomonadales bacterium 4137-cl]
MITSDNRILVIDPGHGGYNDYGTYDGGAVGPSGLHEADVALGISGYLRNMAEAAGWQVLMTRIDQNGSYYLTPRAQMANDAGAALFISVHCNAAENTQAQGAEVWVSRNASQASIDLAAAIQQNLAGMGLWDRGVKAADFTVLTATAMPAVLVETAFISNPHEEQLLAERQEAFAAAIWRGIISWAGVA